MAVIRMREILKEYVEKGKHNMAEIGFAKIEKNDKSTKRLAS